MCVHTYLPWFIAERLFSYEIEEMDLLEHRDEFEKDKQRQQQEQEERYREAFVEGTVPAANLQQRWSISSDNGWH